MQFCPACERPVRELSGTCPHCGKPLGAAAAPPTPAAATPPPAPPSKPVASAGDPAVEQGLSLADDGPRPAATAVGKPGGVEWDSEGDDGGALDLAFDPTDRGGPPPPTPSAPGAVASAGSVRGASVPPGGARAPAGRSGVPAGLVSSAEPDELPAEEVERIAGFARPTSYALAPLYALRALRRLGPLKAELAARREEETRAARFRRESYAQWSRAHGRELAAETALKPTIDAVLRANQALQGFLATRQADFDRFRQVDGALAEQVKTAEADKGRLSDELATRELALRERSDTLARAKARQRRAEIEWRNLERLAQGNVGPSSPHAARAVELQQARAAAAGEVSQAEGEERAARQEAERVRARMAEIDRQLEARREQVRGDPARRRLEDDHDAHRRSVEDALVQATIQALARKVLPPESPDARRLQALDAAEEVANRTRRLYEAAVEGVDRTMIAVGVAVPAALLVLLLVLLAVLG